MLKATLIIGIIAVGSALFGLGAVFGAAKKKSEESVVDVNLYDKETIIEDCTVQVLENTQTGKVSVGWWKN